MKIQLFFVLTTLVHSACGQKVDTIQNSQILIKRSVGLLTGVSFGEKTFVEIGVSKNSNTVVGHHPFSSAYFASTELKFGNKIIIGPKIGGWVSGGVGGVAMGLNMIYYTDFGNSSLAFRPEIGLGVKNLKIVYGYNAILTSHKLNGLNRNLASIVYCLKLKRLGDKIRSR